MEFKCHYALNCDYKAIADEICEGCDYWYEDISGCFVIDENNLLGEIDSAITTDTPEQKLKNETARDIRG